MNLKHKTLGLSLKPKIPDSSRFRVAQVPGRATPEFPILAYANDLTPMKSNRAYRFFSSNSQSVSKSTIVKSSETVSLLPTWEINERVDSFLMRSENKINSNSKLEVLQLEFVNWDKTVTEICKILMHHSAEFSELVGNLHQKSKKFLQVLLEKQKIQQEKDEKKILKLKLSVKHLSSQLMVASRKIKENEEVQHSTNEQINKEIEEIFGKDHIDAEALREKIKNLKARDSLPAADLLKDVLEELNKERYIPEYKPQSLAPLDINEYLSTLQEKFKNLQESTVKRVIRYFEPKVTFQENFTQTTGVYIEVSVFKETKDAFEKLQKQFNSLTAQNEKIKSVNKDLEQTMNVLVDEKAKLATENLMVTSEVQKVLERERILKEKIQKFRREEQSPVIISPYLREKSSVNNRTEEVIKEEKLESQLLQLIERKESVSSVLSQSKSKSKSSVNLSVSRENSPRSSRDSKISKKSNGNAKNLENLENLENSGGFHFESDENEDKFSDSSDDKLYEIPKFTYVRQNAIKEKQNIAKAEEILEKGMSEEELEIKAKESVEEQGKVRSSLKNQKKGYESTESKSPGIRSKSRKTTKIQEKSDDYSKFIQTSGKKSTSTSPTLDKKPKPISMKPIPSQSPDIVSTITSKFKESFSPYPDSPAVSPKLNDSSLTNSVTLSIPKNNFSMKKPAAIVTKNLKTTMEMPNPSKNSQDKSIKAKPPPRKKSKKSKPAEEPSNFSAVTKKDVSVFTESDLPRLDVRDFSAQFSINPPPHQAPSTGVYILPYNPNNFYGLKGDHYFHTSKSIFSAQPLIPELSSSYVFAPPYHLSNV